MNRRLASIFFFFAILLGGVTMYKNIGMPYLQSAIVFIYGVVVVLLYYKDSHAIKRVADSVYFLGFLFTLISILVALAQFGQTGDLFSEIQIFIRNMGVALWTTVVGISLRFAIAEWLGSQYDSSDEINPAESLEQMRIAYQKFLESHDKMSKAIDKFVNAREAETKESLSIQKQYKKEGKVIADHFKKLGDSLKKLSLEVASVGLADKLKDTAVTASSLNNYLKEINTEVKSIPHLPGELNKTLDSFTDLMNKRIQGFDKVEAENIQNEIQSLLEDLRNQLTRIVNDIQSISPYSRS